MKTGDPIAVPFTSRGVASEQSEYGHPDSAILFTILATYYTGLTVSQVRENLEAIAKHDNPGRAYEQMVQSSSNLTGALRDYDAINTDDPYQVAEIHRVIAFDTTAIDFYLNTYVFPRHAKQFSTRLQASCWDLPTTSTATNGLSTTGFSGTNDSRDSLPLSISQQDLPSLVHTSAEVLSYFLQPRNRGYEVLRDINGRRLPETGMLRKLNQLSIRVLIDTGATILEMSNFEVARTWLDIDTEATAAVFFDTQNKAIVLFRQGKSEPLAATSFAEDLTGLIVYIDHSHSRGIVSYFWWFTRPPHWLIFYLGHETCAQCKSCGHSRSLVAKGRTGSRSYEMQATVHHPICYFLCTPRGPQQHSRFAETRPSWPS